MAEVVQAFSESIEDFVRREGAVTTASVAYRFGLEHREARHRLSALRSAGRLVSEREIVDIGTMNGWRIPESN